MARRRSVTADIVIYCSLNLSLSLSLFICRPIPDAVSSITCDRRLSRVIKAAIRGADKLKTALNARVRERGFAYVMRKYREILPISRGGAIKKGQRTRGSEDSDTRATRAPPVTCRRSGSPPPPPLSPSPPHPPPTLRRDSSC